MKEYTFTARLMMLLGIIVLLTIINSYIPHQFSLVRGAVSGIQLVFMATTMGITLRRVLEDY